MTRWGTYLWKECRQNRGLALAGLIFFLGISLIPTIIESIRFAGEWSSGPCVATFQLGGPLLALIAGVCAMGREQGHIQSFWRSHPVDLRRWLASKYLVGLILTWAICWAPVLVVMVIQRFGGGTLRYVPGGLEMLPAHGFILLQIYSVSFVLGLYIRGILHAVILAAGAMALIYLVPMIVAPLSWMSIAVVERANIGVLNAYSFLAFAASTVISSALLLWAAGILLKRDIQIDVDRRTLSWSVVILLLVFAAGIAFPMGTNLSPQQVITLPTSKRGGIHKVVADGNNLLVLLSDKQENERGTEYVDSLISIRLGKEDALVGDPIRIPTFDPDSNASWKVCETAWSAENPFLVYTLFDENTRNSRGGIGYRYALCVVDLSASEAERIINHIDLTSLFEGRGGTPTMFLHKQRLYVLGARNKKLLVFSLETPEAPALIADETFRWSIGLFGPGMEYYSPEEHVIVEIPPLGLDVSDRLLVTRQFSGDTRQFDHYPWWPLGDKQVLACVPDRSGIPIYDPSGIDMQLVMFEIGRVKDYGVALRPVARRRAPVLEFALGRSYGQLCCSGPLAYSLDRDRVTVYDISRPGRIERVGHYAAGERFSTVLPLPDNRVVIVGEKLHVLDLSGKVAAASTR